MTILVADVGGTSSRLAITSQDGRFIVGPVRYANRDFGSFDEVLADFILRAGQPDISACCVAMAGPVGAGQGRLTNLDWQISGDGLKTATGVGTALVINDLTALGYAVARLQPGARTMILPQGENLVSNGQSLVIGVGTGFNICPVRPYSGVTICLEAEAGHAALPAPVRDLLAEQIGARATEFTTVEALFSGRGLGQLHRALWQDASLSASQIVQTYLTGKQDEVAPTLSLFTRSLALQCQSLMLQFMPLGGVYFAGSVARAVFATDMAAVFATEVSQHSHFKDVLTQVPVCVINDDAAALSGCLAALKSRTARAP